MEVRNPLDEKINSENSVNIQPGEIAFTKAEATRHIIGNPHAPICVNMAVYNPQTKQLAFAHFEPFSFDDIKQALDTIDQRLNEKKDTQLQVYFGSGSPRSKGNRLYNRLYDLASERWEVKGEFNSWSMAFDSKTGTATDSVTKEQLGTLDITTKDRAQKRLDSAQFGSCALNIVFDATENLDSQTVTPEYLNFFNSPVLTEAPSFKTKVFNLASSFASFFWNSNTSQVKKEEGISKKEKDSDFKP